MTTRKELEAGLPHIQASSRDSGVIEMIVRRPATGEREVLEAGRLDVRVGLEGDMWAVRPGSRTPDGGPDPDKQVTLMNSRLIQLIAGSRESWPLAGDQLYVDLDLSAANLPPGTRLTVGEGEVEIEITAKPHTGCAKFVERFGVEAAKFVNSQAGRALNLRGVNARVLRSGTVRRGDTVVKSVS